MTIVATILDRELNRNKILLENYEDELKTLPRGTITVNKIKNNAYYYLKYREGNKIVSKYIGKTEEDWQAVEEKLDRRKHVEAMIKQLKEERNQLEKAVKIL